MSWERVPESNELWQRASELGDCERTWLYIQDEDGSYVRATRDERINSEVIGKALLVNDDDGPINLAFGQATMQGARAQQEDRVWVQDSDFLPYCSAPTAHFMVADGHVGDCAAEFATRRLPTATRRNMQEALASWVHGLGGDFTKSEEPFKELNAPVEEPTEVPPASPITGDDLKDSSPSRKRCREEGSAQDENESPRSKVRRKTEAEKYTASDNDQLHNMLAEAIVASYDEVDADFLRMNKTSKSGSTCSSVTILGTVGVFANIGDSRMILVKHPPHELTILAPSRVPSSKVAPVVRISADHKPGYDSEKQRITQAGGTVRRIGGCWRVLPDVETGTRSGVALAVSRSFGDRMLKKYVISEPDVTVLDLKPDSDAAVIIATDGVWDTIDDQAAGKLVYAYHESRDAERAARALIKAAYQAGSEDNITCAVAFIYAS